MVPNIYAALLHKLLSYYLGKSYELHTRILSPTMENQEAHLEPAPTTKVEVPPSTPSNFFTGVDVEEQSFTWTIGNFNAIRKHERLIRSQWIELIVVDTTGQPIKWTVQLGEVERWQLEQEQEEAEQEEAELEEDELEEDELEEDELEEDELDEDELDEDELANLGGGAGGARGGAAREGGVQRDDRRWIRIYSFLHSTKPTPFRSQLRFTIKNKNGEVIKEGETGLMYIKDSPYGGGETYGYSKNLIDADLDQDDLCHWGSLVINIKLKMYTPSKPQSLGSTEPLEAIQQRFQVMFLEQFQKDFADVLNFPDPSADIKIVANDGKEFTMKRGILAVRSKVFAAMLSSDMIEAKSGVIHLPDISSNALKVLLNFFGTGELLPEWRENEVILDLTNAAAKYQLRDLLYFLDLTLGRICRFDNAIPFLKLARQLDLKVAEEELIKFIRTDLMGSDESFMRMLNTLTDESGEPEKKRQKLN